MKPQDIRHHFVDVMAKHLPPSSSKLKLLDIDGQTGDILSKRRGDLDVHVVQTHAAASWVESKNDVDAVVAYDIDLASVLLYRILEIMRPGGRFIAVMPAGHVSVDHVKLLENHGYVRILVEPAIDDLGVLMRGEKPHTTADTLDRIQQVAGADADLLNLETFKGRYVHLLIRQTPNKPVWKLLPDEKIEWNALGINHEEGFVVIGFSSLPKAVAFMQPAVVEGIIHDINKVGKFSKDTMDNWDLGYDVLLNPTLESVHGMAFSFIEVGPDTAEASDE